MASITITSNISDMDGGSGAAYAVCFQDSEFTDVANVDSTGRAAVIRYVMDHKDVADGPVVPMTSGSPPQFSATLTKELANVDSTGPAIPIDFGVTNHHAYVVTQSGKFENAFHVKHVPVTITGSAASGTIAFHHGNFDYLYADGTVEDAANNGHVYADTPVGTYSWGTLDSRSTTTTGTTYTWTPPTNFTATDLLMVAGGGGGGSWVGGGGGAGGLLAFTNVDLVGQQTLVVGNGGTGAIYASRTPGSSGSNTTFTGLTAIGGGGGGSYAPSFVINATTGGSGGGGGGEAPTTGAAGTSGQGNAGGNGNSNGWAGGGGGGAGQVGYSSPSNDIGGNGG